MRYFLGFSERSRKSSITSRSFPEVDLPKETTSSTGLTSELARTTFWPRRTFQYNWGSISYLEFIDSLKTARNHEKPS